MNRTEMINEINEVLTRIHTETTDTTKETSNTVTLDQMDIDLKELLEGGKNNEY